MGIHYSPEDFYPHLRPYLLPHLHSHRFVDLFGGQGNLLLPLVQEVPPGERNAWAERHLLLVDLREEAVERARVRLVASGLTPETARRVARRGDSLREELLPQDGLPVFHLTNPPFLYLGQIRKNPALHSLLPLFRGTGATDLYALALMRDLGRPNVRWAAYVLPANFLVGQGAEGIRRRVLDAFRLERAWLWELPPFPDTDLLVGVFLLRRKDQPQPEAQEVPYQAVGPEGVWEGVLHLRPERGYRPGEAFWSYLEDYRAGEPLAYRLYLPLEELLAHQGPERLRLVDASRYREGKGYALRELGVDRTLAEALRRSPLYLRTLDSGTWEGRAGIRPVSELGGEGVFHSGRPHRTHPIAVRFQGLDREGALLAAQAFDVILEHFRASCRSLFLSDYKGSRAAFYPRKYLGLQTAKALLDTLPQRLFSPEHRGALREALASGPEALLALRERVGG